MNKYFIAAHTADIFPRLISQKPVMDFRAALRKITEDSDVEEALMDVLRGRISTEHAQDSKFPL